MIQGTNLRYYFRLKVPKDIWSLVGQHEIRRSVKTTDLTIAAVRALQLARSWHQYFEKLRMTNLKDILNDPLRTDLITVRRKFDADGRLKEEIVTLENEEDAKNYAQMNNAPPTVAVAPAAPTDPDSYADKPITALIQDYLTENNKYWEQTVYNEYKALYRDVIAMIGNVPVRAVTRSVARGLKTTLEKKRRKGKPLSRSTINKTIGKMSSVWKHGIDENLGIPDKYNPWKGLYISSDAAESDEQPQYEIADLQQLFSQKLADAVNNRPSRYWIPILSLYNGFRLNEPAQLELKHIKNEDGIWTIRIAKEMRLKTKNSVRTVPIHSEVIKLGFLDFVEQRRKAIGNAADKRLFTDLKINSARKGGAISTFWNDRYTSKFRLTPETSFHSIRHSFITVVRSNTKLTATHRAEVAGHVKGDTQSDKRYAKTVLIPLQEVVESAQYPKLQIPPWSAVKITKMFVAK